MKLFILRHGEAEHFMQPDEDRVLTTKGIVDAQSIGKKIHDESIKIDTVVMSPYVRTQETLENFQQQYGLITNIYTDGSLTPDGGLRDVYKMLAGLDEHSCVLLVSHLPLVSILIANLVGGSESDMYQYPMAPASLAEIDLDTCAAGCGVLRRLLSPPYNDV